MDETRAREPFHWRTAIAYKTRQRVVNRGYDVNELAGNLDFGQLTYLLWKGELPTENQGKMMNALFVISTEHAFSPSTVAARFVASGGNPLNVTAAAGIMAMGDMHGTPERLAKITQEGVNRAHKEGKSLEQVARELLRDFKERGERIGGFHHPQHIKDPRAPRLVQLAREYGVVGDHLRLAISMQEQMKEVYGRQLWLNVEGVIGVIASDLGFHHSIIRAFAIVPRLVSCVAHACEESQREPPWRASTGEEIIQPLDLSLQKKEFYDGPPDRKLPEELVKSEVPEEVREYPHKEGFPRLI